MLCNQSCKHLSLTSSDGTCCTGPWLIRYLKVFVAGNAFWKITSLRLPSAVQNEEVFLSWTELMKPEKKNSLRPLSAMRQGQTQQKIQLHIYLCFHSITAYIWQKTWQSWLKSKSSNIKVLKFYCYGIFTPQIVVKLEFYSVSFFSCSSIITR